MRKKLARAAVHATMMMLHRANASSASAIKGAMTVVVRAITLPIPNIVADKTVGVMVTYAR